MYGCNEYDCLWPKITVQRGDFGYLKIIEDHLSVDFGAVLVLLKLFDIYSRYEWELLLYLHFSIYDNIRTSIRLRIPSSGCNESVIHGQTDILIGDFWYLRVS
jgi:hypothetical protein